MPITLNHKPLKSGAEDVFKRRPVARLLKDIVKEIDRGCIGVLGPWGAGKSSLLTLLEEETDDTDLHIVSVNLWSLPSVNAGHHLVISVAEKLQEDGFIPEDKEKEQPHECSPKKIRSAIFDPVSVMTEDRGFGQHPDATHTASSEARKEQVRWYEHHLILVICTGLIFIAVFGLALFEARLERLASAGVALLMFLAMAPAFFKMLQRVISKAISFQSRRVNQVHFTSYMERRPQESASYLKKLIGLVRNDRDRRLIIWLEDLDRCSPEQAKELLSILRTAFDVPQATFIVECDEKALASKLENGEDLLRKAFDHTLCLRPPPPWLIEELLKHEGEAKLELDNEILQVIKATVGPNPRQLKRVIESVAQAKRLLKIRAEDADVRSFYTDLDFKPIAYLEAIRERWPRVWHRLEHRPERLRQLLDADFSKSFKKLPHNEEQGLQEVLWIGRHYAPRNWAPYLRFQEAALDYAGGISISAIEEALLYGDLDTIEEFAWQASQDHKSSAFAAALVKFFDLNTSLLLHMQAFRASRLVLKMETYENSESLYQGLYQALLGTHRKPLLKEGPPEFVVEIMAMDRKSRSSSGTVSRANLVNDLINMYSGTMGAVAWEAKLFASLFHEELITGSNAPTLIKAILAWLESDHYPQAIQTFFEEVNNNERARHLFTKEFVVAIGEALLSSRSWADDDNLVNRRPAWQAIAKTTKILKRRERARLVRTVLVRHKAAMMAKDNTHQKLLEEALMDLPAEAFNTDEANEAFEIFSTNSKMHRNAAAIYLHLKPEEHDQALKRLLKVQNGDSKRVLAFFQPNIVNGNPFETEELFQLMHDLIKDEPEVVPKSNQLKKFIEAWNSSERDDADFAALIESSGEKFWNSLVDSLKSLVTRRSVRDGDRYQAFRHGVAKVAKKKIKSSVSATFELNLLRSMLFGMDADDRFPKFIIQRLLRNYDPCAASTRFSARQIEKAIRPSKRIGPTHDVLKQKIYVALTPVLRKALDDHGALTEEWLSAFKLVCQFATEEAVEVGEPPTSLFDKASAYTKVGDKELTKLFLALTRIKKGIWQKVDHENVRETLRAHHPKISNKGNGQKTKQLLTVLDDLKSTVQEAGAQ